MLLVDKRAFFLVSTANVGAQIYELVANSKDEKNKFVQVHLFPFCHRNIAVIILSVSRSFKKVMDGFL